MTFIILNMTRWMTNRGILIIMTSWFFHQFTLSGCNRCSLISCLLLWSGCKVISTDDSCPLVREMRCALIFGLQPAALGSTSLSPHQFFFSRGLLLSHLIHLLQSEVRWALQQWCWMSEPTAVHLSGNYNTALTFIGLVIIIYFTGINL